MQGKTVGLRVMSELFIESGWLKPQYEEKCRTLKDTICVTSLGEKPRKFSEREKLCYLVCQLLKKDEDYPYNKFDKDLTENV
ncbi:unnamed protein product, partial [marine sediment metagenome]